MKAYNKFFLISLFLLSLTLLVYHFFSNIKLRNATAIYNNSLREMYRIRDMNGYYENLVTNFYKYEHSIIKNTPIYSVNESEESINMLFDLLTTKILLFYFPENICTSCTNSIVELLDKNFYDSCYYEKIFFLTTNKDLRLGRSFVKRRIISIETSVFNDSEMPKYPFLMLIDENKNSISFFIPDKRYLSLTDKYFKTIKERL